MKRNGFQPSIRPKSKKKPSPLNSQTHVCQDDIRKFKIIQKEREKGLPREAHLSLISWCGARGAEGRHFQDKEIRFSSFMIMGRGWFSSLTSSHVSRKNGLRQHQWKQEMMEKVVAPPHCPLVYGELTHKTICGNISWNKKWLRGWDKSWKDQEVCHGRPNQHHPRATTTVAQHSGGPCSSSSWSLRRMVWR